MRLPETFPSHLANLLQIRTKSGRGESNPHIVPVAPVGLVYSLSHVIGPATTASSGATAPRSMTLTQAERNERLDGMVA